MLTGRVVTYDESRGYGFIAPDGGGEDVFVHANVLGEDKLVFAPGLPVEFEATSGNRGMKALAVRVRQDADRAPARPPAGVRAPDEAVLARSDDEAVLARSDDDIECDVLSGSAFRQEITEALLAQVPTLTGAQVTHVREVMGALARRHGWLE